MFDVGFSEMLLVAVLALLVLGPERLPRAARTAGGLIRRARQSWAGVRAEVERELQAEDMRREVDSWKDAGRKARETVEQQGGKLRDALNPRKPPHHKSPEPAPDQPNRDERDDT